MLYYYTIFKHLYQNRSGDMTTKILGVNASLIANRLIEQGINVSGSYLELLDYIDFQAKYKPISNDELSEKSKLPKQTIDYMTKKLEQKKLIEHASPEWIVSKKGKEVLLKARKIANTTTKIIECDSYLSVLAKNSRPLICR